LQKVILAGAVMQDMDQVALGPRTFPGPGKVVFMSRLNPMHVEAVIDLINHGPFFRHLSMRVKDMGTGYSLVELDMANEHLNPFGGIHGGAYASAIDTAAYWALYCEMEDGAGLTSLDLNIDFLAPASNGKLVIKGQSVKVGRSICLGEAAAVDMEGRLLARGSSKLMVTQGLQTIQEVVRFTGEGNLPPKFI